MISRVLAGLCIVVVVACGGTLPATSPVASGSKPTVVLQAPTNGAVVALGSAVVASGAANDTIGVDHVVLFVDGVSVASSPTGQPSPLMPFSLTWPATLPGTHTLQVFAYRADGTTSDPATVQVTVGASGSAPLGSRGGSFVPTIPPIITPKPTRKPRKTPPPAQQTQAPTIPPTTAPTTDTPTLPPTEPPTAPPTAAPVSAPDDSANEPYQIVLAPPSADCPADPAGPPVAAVGCVSQEISAPGGDTTDQMYFVPVANATYQMKLTSCSDQSGATVFHYLDPMATYGCGYGFGLTMPSSPPAQSLFTVKFGTVAAQSYNAYRFTVYQCAFANCAAQ